MEVDIVKIVKTVFEENIGRSVELNQSFMDLDIDSLNKAQIFLDLEGQLRVYGIDEISKQTENDLYDGGRGTLAKITIELERMLPHENRLLAKGAYPRRNNTKYRHNKTVACPLLERPFRPIVTRHAGLIHLASII